MERSDIGRLSRLFGLAWILAGALSNELVLVPLFSPDGRIETASLRVALWAVSIGLCAWGVVSILARRRPLVLKLNLLICSLAVFVPVLAEGLLRLGIAYRVPLVSSPSLYYHVHQDEYWISHLRWKDVVAPRTRQQGHVERARTRTHPLLGWSQASHDESNPLGLRRQTLSALSSERRKLLFYGDSFVRTIPDSMQEALPETSVVHLGVSGYGTDQIYLMFRETVGSVTDPVVVVGVLLNDLGRSLTRVRIARKPYFVVDEHGDLALRGVPIPADQEEFLEKNAPHVASWLWRLFARRLDLGGEEDERRARSRALNTVLIERLQETCRARQLPLHFVVFYNRIGLGRTLWEEEFLKDELERRDLPYVDTKPALLELARETDRRVAQLFGSDGHHTTETDAFLADLIVTALRDALDG